MKQKSKNCVLNFKWLHKFAAGYWTIFGWLRDVFGCIFGHKKMCKTIKLCVFKVEKAATSNKNEIKQNAVDCSTIEQANASVRNIMMRDAICRGFLQLHFNWFYLILTVNDSASNNLIWSFVENSWFN